AAPEAREAVAAADLGRLAARDVGGNRSGVPVRYHLAGPRPGRAAVAHEVPGMLSLGAAPDWRVFLGRRTNSCRRVVNAHSKLVRRPGGARGEYRPPAIALRKASGAPRGRPRRLR